MDRATSTPRRRSRIVLSLLILAGSSHFGCSELKSQIFGDSKIGELGHVEETNDIYARNTKPRTLMADPNQAQGMIATNPATNVPAGTILTEVDEAGPAMLSPPSRPTDPSAGVALLSPRPIDTPSSVRLASATQGVPNASRILAGAERKPEIKPETIVGEARSALDAMTSYEVALHRQERVNGSLLPEEDVVLAIRRAPRAVRLSWPSGPNQGREVLFRADEPGGLMHIKMANPALPRLSLHPESPMVMKNSRHPVTEAGFDSLVEGLENGVSAGALSYAGIETPEGHDRPSHCLTRTTPNGDRWKVYLDVENHLPSLILAVDAKGQLLERYVFREIKANPADLASGDAFDPVARWGQPRGLLSRLTHASAEQEIPSVSDATPR